MLILVYLFYWLHIFRSNLTELYHWYFYDVKKIHIMNVKNTS